MDIYQDFASVYDRFMDNVPYEEWAERQNVKTRTNKRNQLKTISNDD